MGEMKSEDVKVELDRTRDELERLQLQWYQLLIDLEQSQSELFQTQRELEESELFGKQMQVEMEQVKNDFKYTQEELGQTKSLLMRTQDELERNNLAGGQCHELALLFQFIMAIALSLKQSTVF